MFALYEGNTAMIEQLLAVRVAVDAKDKVRGGVGGVGEGWVAEHSCACPLGYLAFSFHKSL